MSEPTPAADSGLEPQSVQITLDPSSIEMDASGRVSLKDARVLSALMTGAPNRETAADNPNYALCGGNGYQCACHALDATDTVE